MTTFNPSGLTPSTSIPSVATLLSTATAFSHGIPDFERPGKHLN